MSSPIREPSASEHSKSNMEGSYGALQSTKSPEPSQSTIFGSKIPGVKDLRKLLDMTDDTQKGKAFIHGLHSFRASYTTDNGVMGYEFCDWNASHSKGVLEKMASVFLDEMHNGHIFWPDDPNATNYSEKLQYTKHEEHIKEVFTQLLFRQNKQYHRNQSFKRNKENRTVSPPSSVSLQSLAGVIETTRASLPVPNTVPAQHQSSPVESERGSIACIYRPTCQAKFENIFNLTDHLEATHLPFNIIRMSTRNGYRLGINKPRKAEGSPIGRLAPDVTVCLDCWRTFLGKDMFQDHCRLACSSAELSDRQKWEVLFDSFRATSTIQSSGFVQDAEHALQSTASKSVQQRNPIASHNHTVDHGNTQSTADDQDLIYSVERSPSPNTQMISNDEEVPNPKSVARGKQPQRVTFNSSSPQKQSGRQLRSSGVNCVKRFKAHSMGVTGVCFSPDGSTLASASKDASIRLWNTQSMKVMHTLRVKVCTEWVNSVDFSPDGTVLAAGTGDDIYLWDVISGEVLETLRGHKMAVLSVVFSPDGKKLVSTSSDQTIKIWNPWTAVLLRTIKAHSDWINAVAYSPDGKAIASASDDKTVKLWNADTGEEMNKFQDHMSGIGFVAFSPNGKLLASASAENEVKVRDVESGAILWVGNDGSSFISKCSPVLAFSRDNQVLASGLPDGQLKFRNASTGTVMQVLSQAHPSIILSLAFSPDGKRLASGDESSTFKLWDTTSINTIETPILREFRAKRKASAANRTSTSNAKASDDNASAKRVKLRNGKDQGQDLNGGQQESSSSRSTFQEDTPQRTPNPDTGSERRPQGMSSSLGRITPHVEDEENMEISINPSSTKEMLGSNSDLLRQHQHSEYHTLTPGAKSKQPQMPPNSGLKENVTEQVSLPIHTSLGAARPAEAPAVSSKKSVMTESGPATMQLGIDEAKRVLNEQTKQATHSQASILSQTPALTSNPPATTQPSQLDILYFVVRSRIPEPQFERWFPDGGRFMDKTLEEVLQSAFHRPTGSIEGLVFTLNFPNRPFRKTVNPATEDEFRACKVALRAQMGIALAKTDKRPLVVEMVIEMLTGDWKEDEGEGKLLEQFGDW